MRTPIVPGIVRHGVKLFLIPFFVFHYGLFVISFLGGKMPGNDPVSGRGGMIARVSESGGNWFVIAIIASHLFSFGLKLNPAVA